MNPCLRRGKIKRNLESLHAFVLFERDGQWQRSFKNQLHPHWDWILTYVTSVLLNFQLCTEVPEEWKNRTDLAQRCVLTEWWQAGHGLLQGRWAVVSSVLPVPLSCPSFLGCSKGILTEKWYFAWMVSAWGSKKEPWSRGAEVRTAHWFSFTGFYCCILTRWFFIYT